MAYKLSTLRLSGSSLVVFFVAVMILVAGQRWYVARNDLAANVVSLAGIVGANASAALAFDDPVAAAEILSSLHHDRVVAAAFLTRKDGSTLAAYHAESALKDDHDLPQHAPDETIAFSLQDVWVTMPVRLHERTVGTVTLRASQRTLYGNLLRFIATFIVIGSVAFLLAQLATETMRRRTLQSEQQRKLAEDARRESERRLRSVTDHLPVCLFQLSIDDDGVLRFSYVSDGAPVLLGLRPDELTASAETFFSRIHADDRPPLEAELRGRTAEMSTILWQGRFSSAPTDTWIEIRGTRGQDPAGGRIVSGVMQDVTQLRRYQLELEQSRVQLRDLIAHRESVVDEVHKNVAREIHDQLGQIITAALMHLRLLERSLPPGDASARELVASIDGLLNEAYRSMKDIAVSLRPAVLNFGFVAAAEWVAARMLDVAGISWRVSVSDPPPRLDDRQAVAFFRIIQESLSNCVRHADASEVRISLSAQDGNLVLEIADNGSGRIANADNAGRFGLLGMRERAESLGGTATFDNAPKGGMVVKVTVPAVVP